MYEVYEQRKCLLLRVRGGRQRLCVHHAEFVSIFNLSGFSLNLLSANLTTERTK